MDNVVAAFDLVQSVGAVVQVNKGPNFGPGFTKQYMPFSEHFQGIQRIHGTNRIVLSGSGLTEGVADLFLIEIASAADGGGNLASAANFGPPTSDQVVSKVGFDGEYDHAGGFSIWGNYLAVGAEAGCSVSTRAMGGCAEKSRVHFFDVSNPSQLLQLSYMVDRPDATAGNVGLVQESDGKFLLVVGRGNAYILDFYRSSATSLDQDPGFVPVGTWSKESMTHGPDVDADYGEYQNTNLVMQTNGEMFMFGFYRTGMGVGDDFADLFRVTVPAAGGQIAIHKLVSRQLSGSNINFQAGGGVYVASPQSLVIYGVDWVPHSGVVTVNEFQSGCARDTGGTCSFGGCSSSRGATDCVGRKCFCQTGYCAVGGACVAPSR